MCSSLRENLSKAFVECRLHAQVVAQVMLHHFPALRDPTLHPQLAAVFDLFQNSPSMQKLEKIQRWLLQKLRPEAAEDPWQVFDEVSLTEAVRLEYLA